MYNLESQQRILLVEDDPRLNQVMSEMVTLLGHNVYAVTTAEEALKAIEVEQFSALFTDINLPGKSGIELAKAVFAKYSATKIIFMTGDGYLVSSPLPFAFTLMAKPVFFANLRDALKKVGVWQPKELHNTRAPGNTDDSPRNNELQ
jgi:DNA-binding NtrC family response regulator